MNICFINNQKLCHDVANLMVERLSIVAKFAEDDIELPILFSPLIEYRHVRKIILGKSARTNETAHQAGEHGHAAAQRSVWRTHLQCASSVGV